MFSKKFLGSFMLFSGIILSQAAHANFVLQCDSIDDKYNRCDSNEGIQGVQLQHQDSHADCEYGRSWGYDGRSVWVDRGCRASFYVITQQSYGPQYLDCSSNDDHLNRCFANGPIYNAYMVRQLSHANCQQGYSWGYDSNSVWVDRGCRATFQIQTGGYPFPNRY